MIPRKARNGIELVPDEGPVVPIGCEEPLHHPVERYVVVSGRHDERNGREALQIVTGRPVLPDLGPLGEVTRQNDEVGTEVARCNQEGERHGRVVGLTEVEVGAMNDRQHGCRPCAA